MTGKLVTLASYSDSQKAQSARQTLEAVGILTHLNKDAAASSADGLATVKLEVAEADLERAREILAASRPSDPGIQEQSDDDDLPQDLNSIEALAERAWRSALIGLITLPVLVHILSVWFLFRVISRDETLSEAGSRKIYGALAINAVVFLLVALFIRGMFAG